MLTLGNRCERIGRLFNDGAGALLGAVIVVQVRIPHPEHDEE